ncbi:unnamed protein product [Cunninghamella blakesleeana]
MVTELNMKRTTIHLPKSKNKMNKQCNAESYQQLKSYDTTIFGGHFLVSDTLYFEVPQSISDNDISQLLSLCQPVMVRRNKHHDHVATGWIRFSNKEQADRAYTLYDGLIFKNSHRLQLYITPDGVKDQEPSAPIFQIANLPQWMTNEKLFNLFRTYGPIRLCKIIVEKDHSFNGTALLQYFDENDANTAKMIMENKTIDKKQITIFPLVSSKSSQTSASTNQQQSNKQESNSVIDYTNLYIKNLDLAAKSNDLFAHFRSYGRIISARVMKNPETKQSRGYGFVSFSQPDEAKNALENLNNTNILSKPIVIAFHEPKKRPQDMMNTTNNDNNTNNTNNNKNSVTSITTMNNNQSSSPSVSSSSLAPSPSPQQKMNVSSPPLENNFYRTTNTTTTTTNHHHDHHHHHNNNNNTMNSIHSSTNHHYQSSTPTISSPSPTYMMPSSNEQQIQRDRIRSAILSLIDKNNIDDFNRLEQYVDMIMTLRPTSRMLCLFNTSYLVTKIDEFRRLITSNYIMKDESQLNTTTLSHHHYMTPTLSQQQHHHHQQQHHHHPKTPNLIQHDHQSNASSSTSGSSPVMSSSTSNIVTDIVDMNDFDQHQFISRFVESMKNLSVIQQKQQLGDLLFPYVKATGVKQASKVTIQLLDTQPLDKLAYSMHSLDLLKPMVDKASNTLTQQQKLFKAIMQK